MNHSSLIKIIVKSFGLYFALQILYSLKDLILSITQTFAFDDDPSFIISLIAIGILNIALNTAIAWFLIFKTDFISTKLTAGNDEKLNIPIEEIKILEFILIGICGFVIINSIPEIISRIINYVYFNPYDRYDKEKYWDENDTITLTFSIVKLLVGIFFLTNYKSIAKLLNNIDDNTELTDSEK